MRLGSRVCGLLISIIYLMISYIFNGVCCFVSFVCQSIGEVPPPSLYTLQTIVFCFYFLLQVFFKDTLYRFYLSMFCLQYFLVFTLTQVVLLSITSTFTRVQIQSNLGTTAYCDDLKVMSFRAGKKNFLPVRTTWRQKNSCRPTKYFCAKSACA
jgi:hypothetical protein